MMGREWVAQVRSVYDQTFSYTWDAHLRALNDALRLEECEDLRTPRPDLPPAWFNGDIEALEPGRWTLVISLNPGLGGDLTAATAMYADRHFTPQEYWDHWRTFNTGHFFTPFFRPLVRLAAGALGENPDLLDEREYATRRMLFIEICPYASQKFSLSVEQVAGLDAIDIAFQWNKEIRQLAIEGGQPALILVNGNAAVSTMESGDGAKICWEVACNPSVSKPGTTLRHRQGHYRTDSGRVPIAGFPFLRRQGGFNSYQEIGQLATCLRKLILEP